MDMRNTTKYLAGFMIGFVSVLVVFELLKPRLVVGNFDIFWLILGGFIFVFAWCNITNEKE